jgi:hypothetical protein
MEFNLRSETYGHIRFMNTVPDSFEKWIIPGSQPFIAKGKFGSILIQQITTGNTNLFYSICNIRENLALDFVINEPVWGTHIALENINTFEINKTTMLLKQGQFNMVNSTLSHGSFLMEAGNRYRTLTISYAAEHFANLSNFFPYLKNFTGSNIQDRMRLLFKHHHWINSSVIDMTNHLLSCLYKGNLRRYYLNLMVKELLFSLLSLEYTETIAGKRLDSHKAQAINEARYILETSYWKPVTLRKIARQVEMDEKELENRLDQLLGT